MQSPNGGRERSAPAPTRFALQHPGAVLITWLVVVAALAVVGLGIDSKLAPGSLDVAGSQSAQARTLIGGNFGDSATVPVLLRGPRSEVKRQGKALAHDLAQRPGVRVLSPWSASSGRSALRPSSDRALLLLSVSGSRTQIEDRSEAVKHFVARETSKPVQATVTGMPLLSSEGTRMSLSAIHKAELIALPLLFIALLLVFQSFAAAAIPAVFGAATIASATGLLALIAPAVHMDSFALAISCMVGLALAVDYSLLLVSRVREELGGHTGDVRGAVGRAAAPTSRTVAVAAAAIIVAMAVAAGVSPGTGLVAAAIGVSVTAAISAAVAMLVVPAMLALAGPSLGTGAPSGGTSHGISASIAHTAMRRPVLGLVGALVLLAACVPVLGLRTGAPTAKSLPSHSDARQQYDAVAKAMGAGWTEPFEIVAVTHSGAVTTAARLNTLARVQREIARDPAVRAVLGPGSIARSAAELRRSGRRALAASSGAPSRQGKRLKKLGAGVSSAADGAGSLHDSLASATSAADRVASGSSSLASGVGALQSGIDGAGSGARKLSSELADAQRGASGLAAQSETAIAGARGLRDGTRSLSNDLGTLASGARDLQTRLRNRADALDRLRSSLRQADASLASAERQVMPTTAANIRARGAIQQARQQVATAGGGALDELVRQIGTDSEYASRIAGAVPTHEAAKLATAVGQLADNAQVITKRVRELGGSVGALTQGSDGLAKALDGLDGGTGKISEAVRSVAAGVDGLASGVRSGAKRTGALASSLDSARDSVKGLGGGGSGAGGGGSSPKATSSFFDSGYFLLAALESGNNAPMGVNVDHGGQGARIVVVPRYAASDPRTKALYERLRTTTGELGKAMQADAAVGGPAAMIADYNAVAGSRLPIIVIVLTIVTALLLGVLLRSIAVPIIGVVLNLLAVGATLGIMALLFQGSNPLLGGPGELDAIAVTAIFGVIFALSIDYQVFILSRVREEWLRTGDEERALEVGLSRTARVVTGAALSMLGVFIAFGLADIASLRQFGVGLAIAIIIDATLVRLVMLPAALLVAGEWTWYSGFEYEDHEAAPFAFEPPVVEPEPELPHAFVGAPAYETSRY
jgi:RND superfamily putative drug exporter